MDLYRANDASDFQPSTQDPQSGVTGNLQQGSANLQPVTSGTGSQQGLPSVERLQVLGVENPTSPGTHQTQPVKESNGFPLDITLLLVLLVGVVIAMFWLAWPSFKEIFGSNISEEETEAEEAELTEVATKTKVAMEEAAQKKTAKKSKAAKPSTKKKKNKPAKKQNKRKK